GLYNIEGLKVMDKRDVKTPFGDPSDSLTIGRLEGRELVFLPRHGEAHTILPSEINYRANIHALKQLDVDRIISLSACGSFKKELKPRDIVIVSQFYDRTNQARKMTFFGEGIVAHVAFGEPVCDELNGILFNTAKDAGLPAHDGGTYVNMEGPAFSTKAESFLYKGLGMDVIGMTNLAEARLAREAEICYSTVAFITDYDSWHEEEGIVTVEMIVENLTKNTENAKLLLKRAVPLIPEERKCYCSHALKNAIFTRPEFVPAGTKKKLELIIGKYMK
ncbi:MAG: S-methyl-5'-thioadenosine phosphorylase, partial [Candidatus Omnitrophota bacterium]